MARMVSRIISILRGLGSATVGASVWICRHPIVRAFHEVRRELADQVFEHEGRLRKGDLVLVFR